MRTGAPGNGSDCDELENEDAAIYHMDTLKRIEGGEPPDDTILSMSIIDGIILEDNTVDIISLL